MDIQFFNDILLCADNVSLEYKKASYENISMDNICKKIQFDDQKYSDYNLYRVMV